MRIVLASLALGVLHSQAHTTSRKFAGLENPEARKEMCKKFITMPCDIVGNNTGNRKRRNAADSADERCQWSHIDHSRNRRSPKKYWQSDDSTTNFSPTTHESTVSDEPMHTTAGATTEAKTTTAAPTTAAPTTAGVTEPSTTRDPCVDECTDSPPAIQVTTASRQTTENPPLESEAPPRTEVPCHQGNEDRQPGILILLDETGSMQQLGGIDPVTNWGRGQGIVIEKFNQFIAILQNQVRAGETPDTEFTLITFNKVAKVVEYPSILEMQPITTEDYNPGYSTNLYDSLGCALSEYVHIHQGPAAKVFIISDGIHQPDRNVKVAWSDHEIHQMVSKLRADEDWEFSFFGAMNPEDKAHLKHEAMNLGIRWSETKKFDFTTNSIDIILKSISSSLKTGAENYEYKSVLERQLTNRCPKGRFGKLCRQGKKLARLQLKAGEFKLDPADDSDQLSF